MHAVVVFDDLILLAELWLVTNICCGLDIRKIITLLVY
jgi:hypothetical protein